MCGWWTLNEANRERRGRDGVSVASHSVLSLTVGHEGRDVLRAEECAPGVACLELCESVTVQSVDQLFYIK